VTILKLKRISACPLLLAAALVYTPRLQARSPADTSLAARIAEHADTLMRGSSNYGTYRMSIIRPDWTRSMTMHSWERGQSMFYLEVIEPAREAGTAYLKREGQMWTWLPEIGRTVKIPPSMMMDSWMGSDFTNDDLVHESSLSKDYDHRLLARDSLDGEDAAAVELVPKEDAPVVWDRIVFWVRMSDFMPLKEEFYDEKGRLVRSMFFKDIKRLDGRLIPTRWLLTPQLKTDQRTEFEVLEINFDVAIPDRTFTRQYLERSR